MRKKRVIITGGDGEYLKMAEVMIRSLRENMPDTFDIRVYSFNCDYSIDGVECIRINLHINAFNPQEDPIDLTKIDFSSYWGKYYGTIHSLKEYEYSVWIDSDCIVTEHMNRIWDFCLTAKNKKHPLFMHYFLEDTSYWFQMRGSEITVQGKYGSELSHMFEIVRNPFGKLAAAGLYIAHRNHIDFIKEALDYRSESMKKSCYYYADDKAFSEERVTNLCMWKYLYKEFLPFTWINSQTEKNLDRFPDPRIKNALKNGFDVIFDERDNSIIGLHGPNKFRLEKNSENLELLKSSIEFETDKIMIVCHPDDEIIFGGSALLEEKGWRVVCLTNGSNNRSEEFKTSMHFCSSLDYECYNIEDVLHKPLDQERIEEIVALELSSKKWKKIVTHNSIGEYGHPHHKQIHETIKKIVGEENLWVFDKGKEISPYAEEKVRIFNLSYPSQSEIFPQIRENRGRWFIDSDMETNYIDHGTISKFMESSKKEELFVACYLK